VLGSGTGDVEFRGNVLVDGTIVGTWTRGNLTGTFDGKRLAGAPVVVTVEVADAGTDTGNETSITVWSCSGPQAACRASMAGDYQGTFDGQASGTWSATLDATTGDIAGVAILSGGSPVNITGAADPSGGMLVFGDASTGVSFSGYLYDDGSVSGTWSRGTFTGARLQGAPH
jgi:hypothetical protein